MFRALGLEETYAALRTGPEGLADVEAESRLKVHGLNELERDRSPSPSRLLARALANPLVVLLATLASISFATGDPRAGSIMAVMMLAATRGHTVTLSADGPDEAEALEAVTQLFADRFGEDE